MKITINVSSLCIALSLILWVLKLCGVIEISTLMILMPIIIMFGVGIAGLIILGLILLVFFLLTLR